MKRDMAWENFQESVLSLKSLDDATRFWMSGNGSQNHERLGVFLREMRILKRFSPKEAKLYADLATNLGLTMRQAEGT